MKPRTTTLLFLLRTALASPQYFGSGEHVPLKHPGAEPGSPEFWEKLIVSSILVLAGGVFAGWVYVTWATCIHDINLFQADARSDGPGRTPPSCSCHVVGRPGWEEERPERYIYPVYLLWLPLILDSVEVDGEGSALGPRCECSLVSAQYSSFMTVWQVLLLGNVVRIAVVGISSRCMTSKLRL